MGKRIRFLTGAAAGAMVQYLYDPNMGRSRRARLADQLAARLRDVREEAGRRLRYESGRVRGKLHEMTPENTDRPTDDQHLLQRIKSEVIGPERADTSGLEVDVDNGVVLLSGRLGDKARSGLVERIAGIEGVRTVEDRTFAGSTS